MINNKIKTQMSQDVNERIKDLLINLLIAYPQITQREIIKEICNHTYFINREQGEENAK